MTVPTTLALDVVATRGSFVESRHRVHGAVVDVSGQVLAQAGNPDFVTFWRSCAKPFQVAPFVRAGGLERFKWGDDEAALACGSHGGEPEHVAIAARMLASIGLEEGDLACGPHEPLTRRGAQMARDAGTYSRLHNNCSGKHAAMLARATMAGWPASGYQRIEHPVQREAYEEVSTWSGVATGAIPIAVDGCGVPVFALSLRAMAFAYARFGAAAAAGENPAARIISAMTSRPFLIGGTERFDTLLIEETNGRLLAKVGAEGVHSVMIPSRGIGLAIKVEDGALRAQHAAVIAALRQIGELPGELPDRIAEFVKRPVKNTRGEVVGELRPEVW
ncbi:MAG TPA: asparaginase [Gemmatimonadaceae bacterium]|nr:asparaginase [Gemmatimonadaceae bacterium]